jgi:hypothetical protein
MYKYIAVVSRNYYRSSYQHLLMIIAVKSNLTASHTMQTSIILLQIALTPNYCHSMQCLTRTPTQTVSAYFFAVNLSLTISSGNVAVYVSCPIIPFLKAAQADSLEL